MDRKEDNRPILAEAEQCERCGRFGAFKFQGVALCGDCYQGCGSCCPEFGADDLWETHSHEKNP